MLNIEYVDVDDVDNEEYSTALNAYMDVERHAYVVTKDTIKIFRDKTKDEYDGYILITAVNEI